MPLGHEDERLVERALDPAREVETEPDAHRAVLDHGSTENGSWRTARIVSPPPQGLSRGKVALSARRTDAPSLARR